MPNHVPSAMFTLALGLAACGSQSSEPGRPPIAMAFDATAHTDVIDRVYGAGISQDGAYSVAMDWALAAHAGTLTVRKADGEVPQSVTDPSVRLLMPSHGHEGLYPNVGVHPRDGAPGVYDLDHFFPSMEGPWQVEVRATVDGVRGKATLAIDFDRGTIARFKQLNGGTHDTSHHCH